MKNELPFVVFVRVLILPVSRLEKSKVIELLLSLQMGGEEKHVRESSESAATVINKIV